LGFLKIGEKMNDENVQLKIEGKIATMTLNRPEKLNVLSTELLMELREHLQSLEKTTTAIRGLILIGQGGRAFSAGGDIKLMDQLGPQGGENLSLLAQSVTLMIENLPIPVMACVDGFALGGGCELAISCDFIYATKSSQFGQPETKIGLIPGFGGCARLMKIIGPAAAKEMIYTGRSIPAEEAYRLGLVNQVFETREALVSAAIETINQIAANSTQAVASAKKTLNQVQDQSIEVALSIERKQYGRLFDHPEKTEGLQAFLQKRAAKF
jgi:enoyl-CoA hydratase